MACEVTAGRLEPCKTVGGLKNIYIIPFESAAYAGITTDANGIITAFAPAMTAFKWEVRGANTFDETGESSKENGTTFYTIAGAAQIKAQDGIAREELDAIAKGLHFVMTEGYDGKYKIYGLEDGCEISISTASGASMGDFNGYNLTVSGNSTELARFVNIPASGLTFSANYLTI